MLNSILSNISASQIQLNEFLLCSVCSLVLGALVILLHQYKNESSRSFFITLGTLPLVVQVIITLVNGSLGTGIAIAGAFSLVRFRSAPGNAREIGSIFLAMTIGLATGMGYVTVAFLLYALAAIMTLILLHAPGVALKEESRVLDITIPEVLDYSSVFDDVMEQYTSSNRLISVKTVDMGSMFRLHYNITLKDEKKEKEMIDAIRVRNGNLPITCSRYVRNKDEL